LQTADLAVNALNDTLTELVEQERVTQEQLETNLKTLRENKDVLAFLEASLSGHSFRDLADKLTDSDLMTIQKEIDVVMQNHIRELAQKNIEDDPDEKAKRERDAKITDVNREIPAQIPKTLTQEQFDAVMEKFKEYKAEIKQKSPITAEGLKELNRKYRPLIRAAAGLKK
jgi:polyribonucleotide nucleotidyltransferase